MNVQDVLWKCETWEGRNKCKILNEMWELQPSEQQQRICVLCRLQAGVRKVPLCHSPKLDVSLLLEHLQAPGCCAGVPGRLQRQSSPFPG